MAVFGLWAVVIAVARRAVMGWGRDTALLQQNGSSAVCLLDSAVGGLLFFTDLGYGLGFVSAQSGLVAPSRESGSHTPELSLPRSILRRP